MSESTSLVKLPQVLEAILTGAIPQVADEASIAEGFVTAILEAQTPGEAFSVSEATPVEQVLQETVKLLDASFMPSSIEDSGGTVYVVCSVVNAVGDKLAVTTGARNVVAQMYKAVMEGWFPQWGAFIEVGKQKANRSRPVYFVLREAPEEVEVLPLKAARKSAA